MSSQQLISGTNFQVVTEDSFNEQLNVLPPMRWLGGGSSESFALGEPYDFDRYYINVRIGSDFYRFLGSLRMSHEDRIAFVKSNLSK